MKRVAKIAYALIFTIICIGMSSFCLSEDKGASTLIEEAKAYAQQGDKEQAIATLDAAFTEADSAGDYEALIKVGDLYISIDKSLSDKAMAAWTAAGRCKARKQ